MTPCAKVRRALERHGLLLQQDKSLPSVVGLITGEALRGSWWSHPRAQAIFDCLAELADHDDVLVTRLVAGKVTYVHQHLWPAFLAVATSREEWQTSRLSRAARALLARVDGSESVHATGPAARELQERLLVSAIEVHTAAGRHAVALQSWQTFARSTTPVLLDDAKRELERALIAIGGKVKWLPWTGARRAAQSSY